MLTVKIFKQVENKGSISVSYSGVRLVLSICFDCTKQCF